jgi:hypothetical protein
MRGRTCKERLRFPELREETFRFGLQDQLADAVAVGSGSHSSSVCQVCASRPLRKNVIACALMNRDRAVLQKKSLPAERIDEVGGIQGPEPWHRTQEAVAPGIGRRMKKSVSHRTGSRRFRLFPNWPGPFRLGAEARRPMGECQDEIKQAHGGTLR